MTNEMMNVKNFNAKSKISRIMCTVGGLGRHVGRYILSTDYRSTVDRLSVDSRPTIGR